MQYLATHYWQSANQNVSSLVLQQAYHKKRKLPVLLACVCSDAPNNLERGRLVTRLADWFYEIGLPLCGRNGEKGIRTISNSLETCLKREVQNAWEHQMAGVLCVGNSLRIFQQGEMGSRLLNMRNYRPYSSELKMDRGREPGLLFQDGILQPGVGILLATNSFYEHVPEGTLEECLNIRELRNRSYMEKRLRELGSLGETRGGTDMGAILLMTR